MAEHLMQQERECISKTLAALDDLLTPESGVYVSAFCSCVRP